MARALGMRLISLTDHDTVAGLHEAESAAEQAGVRFIPGIELSASEDGIDCHILGYGIAPDHRELILVCGELARQRGLRETRIFDYLQNSGVELEASQVYRHTPPGRAGRSHFALALVHAGYAESVSAAFDLYLATPEFSKIDRPKIALDACTALIQNAGGFASLAHPGFLKMPPSEFESFLARLTDAGIRGLECHYSAHTPEETKYYLAQAKKHRLIITRGSDFHGEKLKPGVKIGNC